MKNILLASLLVASPVSFAASFDCQKASTEIEHKICDNERLSKLDEQLSATYSSALKANPENADTLKTVQRQWVNMRGKLTDDKALELAYLIQINGLNGLGVPAATAAVNETPKPTQKQPEVQEKTSKADAKPAKKGNELTLESFRAKYIEVNGEYYSTTSLPRGSSFLFTCASRIADDQVNVWKKHAAKEGKIDLFFELENRIHTAMLNANFQQLHSDLTKTGICDLITAVP
ncbi:lysozyme inhibitor LprI family protein [Enterobacter hormaechei]|uniref:lysozyme inhibitor LprI family protein n=1 Tax=Enterobacter hormaechei TaxID=158836 RepID=UPI000BB96CC9|nr:lysozyme inhibitor LprI family protein [Enterobacter hormaechei]